MGKDIFCTLYETWKNNNQFFVENDFAYGILSVEPKFIGQGLLIPKRHVEKIEKFTPLEAVNFFSLGNDFHKKIIEGYKLNTNKTLIDFYKNLHANPVTPNSKDLAAIMLESGQLYEKPKGFNVGLNFGEGAGQTVNHLHMHYIPRRDSDSSILGVVTAFDSLLNK